MVYLVFFNELSKSYLGIVYGLSRVGLGFI